MTLTKFIRAGAATVGALAMATQVNAADLYSGGMKDAPVYVPAPMWTGFYFGAHLGAGWADLQTNSHTLEADSPWLDTDFPGTYDPGHSTFGGDTLHTTGGAFGGGQLGYNWQASNWVFGLEVDLGGMAANADRTFGASATAYTNALAAPIPAGIPVGTSSIGLRVKAEGGFYGDVTGRLGYTWGPGLLYAKGGFAWLQESIQRVRKRYRCRFPRWHCRPLVSLSHL